jgi:hypothetical protein
MEKILLDLIRTKEDGEVLGKISHAVEALKNISVGYLAE